MILAAVNSKELWYLTRGSGLTALVLLTASVVLGISQIGRLSAPSMPRFVVAGLHRNVSLLAVVFLAIHIGTAVADPFAPIAAWDSVVPFVGSYRPVWLGLGALATDLLLALVLTSLLRYRIGFRTWRTLHWAAYACWPIALWHGLGTGSDSRVGWTQAIYVLCAIAVLVSLAWRLTTRWSGSDVSQRTLAALGAVLVTVGLTAWSLQGPLRPGWAKRAGTPTNLLGGSSSSASTTTTPSGG
jgi:sulfoxide reductase heme-binding subunit YedZ